MKFFGLTSLFDLFVAEDYSNYGGRFLSFLVWCTFFYKPLLSSCFVKERLNVFQYYLVEFFVLKYSMFFQFVMQY